MAPTLSLTTAMTTAMTTSKRIVAVDPGREKSGLVEWDPVLGRLSFHDAAIDNDELRYWLYAWRQCRDEAGAGAELVIEQIRCYGMTAGADLLDTVHWSGRFEESWHRGNSLPCLLMPRMAVKMHLCHDSRAKDANIRQALPVVLGHLDRPVGDCRSRLCRVDGDG